MPRILAIDPRVPTSHGLIIKRQCLAEQTRAHISIKEARAYARRIVKQAQLHAESIKQSAMQQGFDDGWRDSLKVIFQTLQGTVQLHTQLEQALKKTVHETMEKALAQPALELQLLEGWLAATPHVSSALNLVLPRRAQEQAPAIIRRVEETLKITPTVSFGDSDGVVIEYGDQIAEFSPNRTLGETDALAKECVRRLEVKKQMAMWSKHVVQHWLSDLAKRHDAMPPANDDVDMFDDEEDEE